MACPHFRLEQGERSLSYQKGQAIKIEGTLGELESKESFQR